MKIQHLLAKYLKEHGITISYLARVTGIQYELLRRSLNENRVMTADELAAVLTNTEIKIEDLTRMQKIV